MNPSSSLASNEVAGPSSANFSESGSTFAPAPRGPVALWSKDLRRAAEARIPWLWYGYLAPGNVTLLTSQWKTGKTTLVSVLLARLKEGGQLAGLPLERGKAAVVSEEGPAHWYQRSQKLGFGDDVCFFCRPFRGKPRPEEWLDLLDRLAELPRRHGIDLLVIDPLASFLPGHDESNAACMLDTMMPLQRLTSEGMSVLVLHHPRKGKSVAGQAARGSGALAGYVDIIVEMGGAGTASMTGRRRRLQAWSRHEETPRELVIELNAAGTDYLVHGDFQEEDFTSNWVRLRTVLAEASNKLTRSEILRAWPGHWEKPSEATLWRWLERALNQGLVCQDGKGRRNDSYRYWLPGIEDKWRRDPYYLEDLPDLEPLVYDPDGEGGISAEAEAGARGRKR